MNKKLKSIEVGLIGCGDAVTLNASDTATEPIATYALDKFKAEQQMSFKDDGKEYFVPFHAVDHIIITEATESVEDKPNPYGCEAEGDEQTYTIRWGNTSNPDTTGIKIGDSVVVPVYTSPGEDCSWHMGNREIYAWGSEEDRTFEFTQEIADEAENYIIVATTFCWS